MFCLLNFIKLINKINTFPPKDWVTDNYFSKHLPSNKIQCVPCTNSAYNFNVHAISLINHVHKKLYLQRTSGWTLAQ